MIQSRPHFGPADTTYSSLVDVLRQRAQDTPDRLAYQFLVDGQLEGGRLTYAELQAGADAISARLLGSAERGDRALLLYPPGHEFLLAFFGCLQAGIIDQKLTALQGMKDQLDQKLDSYRGWLAKLGEQENAQT